MLLAVVGRWKSAIHLHRRMQLQQPNHTGPIESHPVSALLARRLYSSSFLLLKSPSMPRRETLQLIQNSCALLVPIFPMWVYATIPHLQPNPRLLNDLSAAKKQPKPLPGVNVAGRYELRGLATQLRLQQHGEEMAGWLVKIGEL